MKLVTAVQGALRAALDERVKTARRGCAATQELLKAERARVESAASGARQLQARLPEVDAQLERLAVSLAAERAAIDAETDKLLADINSAEVRRRMPCVRDVRACGGVRRGGGVRAGAHGGGERGAATAAAGGRRRQGHNALHCC